MVDQELFDRKTAWVQNKEILDFQVFIGDFIFSRMGILEFRDLITRARKGEITAIRVLQYINPNNRISVGDSTTLLPYLV